jgi:hypothetical protein
MTDGVHITNEQIFTELRALTDRVTLSVSRLDDIVTHSNDHETRLRVLERSDSRLVEVEKAIVELKAEKRDNRALWVAVAIAALSAVLSWLLPLLTTTGKG